MAADQETVSFKTSPQTREDIDTWKQRHGLDHRSQATEELVKIGLRESQNPLMYRLKGQVIEWAGHLGLAAIMVIVAGFTSTVFTPVHGLQIALVLIAMALVLVATVELARITTGQSELADLWKLGVKR